MNLEAVIQDFAAKFFGIEQRSQYDFGLEQLQQRNEIRRKEAIAKLGERWLLHPNNLVNKPESHE